MKFDYRNHPLIGKWRSYDAEYDNVVYEVVGLKTTLKISGVDKLDGETFTISNVEFDETTLSFTSVMPSTKWELQHKMYLRGRKSIVHEFTKTEIWKKC